MQRSRVVHVREYLVRGSARGSPRRIVQLLEASLEERVVCSLRIDDEQVQVHEGTKLRVGIPRSDLGTLEKNDRAVVGSTYACQQHGDEHRPNGRQLLFAKQLRLHGPGFGAPPARREQLESVRTEGREVRSSIDQVVDGVPDRLVRPSPNGSDLALELVE